MVNSIGIFHAFQETSLVMSPSLALDSLDYGQRSIYWTWSRLYPLRLLMHVNQVLVPVAEMADGAVRSTPPRLTLLLPRHHVRRPSIFNSI
jgi:hypothetical protein